MSSWNILRQGAKIIYSSVLTWGQHARPGADGRAYARMWRSLGISIERSGESKILFHVDSLNKGRLSGQRLGQEEC